MASLTEIYFLTTNPTVVVVKDLHLRDFMEAAEPQKCDKAKVTNTMSSKILRLAFFGMFRKPESEPLDS